MLQKALSTRRPADQHAHTERDASALFLCELEYKSALFYAISWIYVVEEDDYQKPSPPALFAASILETEREGRLLCQARALQQERTVSSGARAGAKDVTNQWHWRLLHGRCRMGKGRWEEVQRLVVAPATHMRWPRFISCMWQFLLKNHSCQRRYKLLFGRPGLMQSFFWVSNQGRERKIPKPWNWTTGFLAMRLLLFDLAWSDHIQGCLMFVAPLFCTRREKKTHPTF